MTAALAAVSLPRARPRAGYLPATYRTVSRSGRLPRRREEAAPPALQPCAATQPATLHCSPGVPEAATGCMGGRSPAHRSRTPHAPGGLAALRPHAAQAAAARGVADRRQGVPGSRPRARGRGERGHELGRQRRGELLLLWRCARRVSRIRGGSPGSGQSFVTSNTTPLEHAPVVGIVGLCSLEHCERFLPFL